GIFLTGGDQMRLLQRVRNTRLAALLHKRHREGVVIAGTSAGSTAIPEVMPTGGQNRSYPLAGAVHFTRGLALLRGVLVDPHFSGRGRIGRLLSGLAGRPQVLALGIDANTALVVGADGVGQVLGEGVVTVLDAGSMTHNNLAGRHKGQALGLFG